MEGDAYLFINSAMIYRANLQGPESGAGGNQEGCCFQSKTHTINSRRKLVNGGTMQRAWAWELQVLSSNLNGHFVSELEWFTELWFLIANMGELVSGLWIALWFYEHPDNHNMC